MADAEPNDWLVILGEPRGTKWVLREQRLAFARNRREVRHQSYDQKALSEGDRLLLYASVHGLPGKHRGGGVFGAGVATSSVSMFDDELNIGGRYYAFGATYELQRLAPIGTLIEVPPLLDRLTTFPRYNERSWGGVLRRPLLKLRPGDYDVFTEALEGVAVEPEVALGAYIDDPAT